MSARVSDFGEPWMRDKYDLRACYGGTVVQSCIYPDRTLACVNALAGIADPAAFVERAKALALLVHRHPSWECRDVLNTLEARSAEIAALAAEWTPDA